MMRMIREMRWVRPRRWRAPLLALLVVGCGSSDEAHFESNRCFSDDLGCTRTQCTTRDTCENRECKIEEGYDDDFDYFYKSKCTENVVATTVETPRDGEGIRTTTVRESVIKCTYKEEVDDDDFEVTDQCTESSETTVTRETCTRDPACPTCAPICSPLDTTTSTEGPRPATP